MPSSWARLAWPFRRFASVRQRNEKYPIVILINDYGKIQPQINPNGIRTDHRGRSGLFATEPENDANSGVRARASWSTWRADEIHDRHCVARRIHGYQRARLEIVVVRCWVNAY